MQFAFSLVAALVVAGLLAAPWIWQSLVWCEWLGIAAALELTRRTRGFRGLAILAAWSTLAIAAAFHWSPRVLAYTIDSSYGVGLLVFVPLVVWDAARVALPFWVAVRFARQSRHLWLVAGLLTVVVESVVPSVFPFRLGYTQIHWPLLIQASDIFGPEWPTLVLFAAAGGILTVVRDSGAMPTVRRGHPAVSPLPVAGEGPGVRGHAHARPWAWHPLCRALLASPAVWLCAANLFYGIFAMNYWARQIDARPSLRVALLQVDPTYRGSTADLRRLTATVSKQVDLVCWPESSGGTYDLALDSVADEKLVFAHSRDPERGQQPWPHPDCPLLLGGKSYSGDRERPQQIFQTALLIDRHERIVGRYQKRHLMPFGEYVPASGWVPGLAAFFNLQEEITAGDKPTTLPPVHGARIGAMLCYEDMVPIAARTLSAAGANLLVSLINGSAFTDPLTLTQHRLLAQLRAVECRRTLLRCSATGETCAISPLGEIESSIPPQTQAVLTTRAPLIEAQTIYCRLGDFFPVLALAATVGLAIRTRFFRSPRSAP